MSKAESRWVLLWAIVIVGLASLPYLVAWQLAPDNTHYTGLLVNHYDGESYYAKMQQGARGDWLFHLPFTPETHEGAFVYTFYLALGHLATLTKLSIPLTYHLARAAAGLFLLLVAYRFFTRFFERVPARRAAFLLLGFSAGFGWLLAPLGLFTADLWVTEGLTFLSILTNPHFPLAIGLMLLTFGCILDLHHTEDGCARQVAGAAVASLALSLIHPIAVPITLTVTGVYLGVLTLHQRHIPWREIIGAGAAALAAAPVMLYILFVFLPNPAMAAWTSQNSTTSLPPWDYATGYGLVLLLAVGGIVVAARRRQPTDGSTELTRSLFLLAWVGTVAVLLYVPFALQRRFITGLHVPLALLATLGLTRFLWPRLPSRRRGLITGLLIGFTALTNLFVSLVAVTGVAQGRPPLVMSRDQADACAWLAEHTAWTDTVLAPPDAGQFIPAWAGNRVVYGHPFETIDAKAKEAEVDHFYSPEATPAERRALLDHYGVRYILVPIPETSLDATALGLSLAWAGGEAALYSVENLP